MGNMNWKFLILCLLGLSFAIEANCLRGTGHMWQQRPPAGGITSCNPASLLPSDAATATATAPAGAAARAATTAIEIAPQPGEVITAPPAVMMLANYVYQCASRPTRMASSCSQQHPKPEPESKPESHPALVWGQEEQEQEQEQHEPEPEVPKPRTVTLVASELEVTRATG